MTKDPWPIQLMGIIILLSILPLFVLAWLSEKPLLFIVVVVQGAIAINLMFWGMSLRGPR
jgi:hypothetical protein